MIIEWKGKRPQVAEGAFIAPTAVLIGDVTVEVGASVWYGVVLRGDQGPIVIGRGANVQDNSVAHVDGIHPTIVGENVTIGHAAVLESCTVERGALVGMKAVVMNGAVVGEESMVAAGAVITEGMQVPPRHLVAGVPAVVKKELSGRSLEWVKMAAPDYHELAAAYLEQGLGETPGPPQRPRGMRIHHRIEDLIAALNKPLTEEELRERQQAGARILEHRFDIRPLTSTDLVRKARAWRTR